MLIATALTPFSLLVKSTRVIDLGDTTLSRRESKTRVGTIPTSRVALFVARSLVTTPAMSMMTLAIPEFPESDTNVSRVKEPLGVAMKKLLLVMSSTAKLTIEEFGLF